jgi:hypothetical protein
MEAQCDTNRVEGDEMERHVKGVVVGAAVHTAARSLNNNAVAMRLVVNVAQALPFTSR